MTFLFLLYLGFTFYLYFSRETIREEVNYVLGRWYEDISAAIRRLQQKSSSRNRRYWD